MAAPAGLTAAETYFMLAPPVRLPPTQPVVLEPPRAGGLHRWLKSDMRVLRWVFLALYVLLVATLFIPLVTGDDGGNAGSLAVLVLVMLAAQALLIFGSGTVSLCHPIRRRRLVLPVLVAASMLALLVAGLLVSTWELMYLDDTGLDADLLLPVVVLASWVGWGVLLMSRLRDKPRYTVLRRLTAWMFAGSLAELLATVPSHVIVSRRPGCLVGLGTAMGIIAGCAVMLFSFGPAVAILFLRPRWRAEVAAGVPYCPACGFDLRASQGRCPECGMKFEEDVTSNE